MIRITEPSCCGLVGQTGSSHIQIEWEKTLTDRITDALNGVIDSEYA